MKIKAIAPAFKFPPDSVFKRPYFTETTQIIAALPFRIHNCVFPAAKQEKANFMMPA